MLLEDSANLYGLCPLLSLALNTLLFSAWLVCCIRDWSSRLVIIWILYRAQIEQQVFGVVVLSKGLYIFGDPVFEHSQPF